jgi:hypothetical protein
MMETDWLNSTQPYEMLVFLLDSGRASNRQFRLFAVACCRRVLHLLGHGACRSEEQQALSRQAVEVAERFADGLVSSQELAEASSRAHLGNNLNICLQAVLPVTPGNSRYATPRLMELACRFVADEQASRAAEMVEPFTRLAAHAIDGVDPRPAHADLWREIVGNPFRQPAPDPALLAWNDRTIPNLARTIYSDRAFEQMPILADALEEAGGDIAELLLHLRGPGPHVRGCWAIDLLRAASVLS